MVYFSHSFAHFRGIHHDPERYTNPSEFIPERFLGWRQTSDVYANAGTSEERDHYAYGAGRRICVGIHIAERNLFINIAKLVWAFNFEVPEGKDVDVTRYTPGFAISPLPYESVVTPRDKNVEKVVENEWNDFALKVIEQYA